MDTKDDTMLRASRSEHPASKQTHNPPTAATVRGWQTGGHYETDPGGNGCLLPSLWVGRELFRAAVQTLFHTHKKQ